MINTIAALGVNSHSRLFDLRNPGPDGIVVSNVDGISPADAVISTIPNGLGHGSRLISATIPDREITIFLKLYGSSGYSMDAQRHELYRVFTPGNEITLLFSTDTSNRHIRGYVSKFDGVWFVESQAPCTAAITITCPDPFFYDTNSETISRSLQWSNPEFEFPWTNPVNQRTLEFSTVTNAGVPMTQPGDINIGFLINIHPVVPLSNLVTVRNSTTGQSITMNPEGFHDIEGVIATDVLDANWNVVLNTNKVDLSAELTKHGTPYSAYPLFPDGIARIDLYPGQNIIFLDTVDSSMVDVSITFTPKYVGV